MSPPRKLRPPGQRQFNPMGTPRDWQRVAKQPGVKRMLRDPQLAAALYQNFRGTGGQMPQQPVGMADGGGIPTPEDLNRLAQIRAGDIDPYSGNQLQELAEESRPARYDTGGPVESEADLDAEASALDASDQNARLRGDLKTIQDNQTKRNKLNAKRASLSQAQAQPSAPVSFGGNLGQVSGSTMANMQRLGQQGPPKLGNMAVATGLGALFGSMSGGGSGAGALIGGATAGLLNYFIRKNAQKQKQQQQQQQQQQQRQDAAQQPAAQSPGPGGTANPTGPAPLSASLPLSPGEDLAYGTANVTGGRVISRDGGKTWTNPNARTPDEVNVDPAKVGAYPTEIISPSQPQTAAPSAGQGAIDEQALTDSMDTGLARGGSVPEGRPAPRMLLPVLHTTIVIAAKPKKNSKDAGPAKKSMGGDIPQAQRRPRKPHAIPPIAGPESSGVRLPHGRVQVPRGSGAAIKGKRFGGVY